MVDRYNGSGDDLLSPASLAAEVIPSDVAALPIASKRLWVGGAGNVSIVTTGGVSVVYSAVPAGSYLRVRAAQVNATGTTATNIIAEY